jgi:predicted permease
MLSQFRSWMNSLVRRRRLERDMADELSFHVQARADHWVGEGLTREEAVRRARLEFGGVERFKEECRQSRGLRLADELAADLRYGLRQLRRAPVFSCVAIVTLALAIGANTAIFSLVDAVLLKELHVERPEDLRELEWTARRGAFSSWYNGEARTVGGERVATSFAHVVYAAMRDRSTSFSDLFAFQGGEVGLVSGGRAQLARTLFVSGNFFRGLGLPVVAGRPMAPEDDRAGAPAVAVLGHAFWQRAFGGDPSVLGRTIVVIGVPVVVVGIAPPSFTGVQPGRQVDVLLPIAQLAEPAYGVPEILHSPRHWGFRVMGRLKAGVDDQLARAETENLLRDAIRADPPAEAYDPPRLTLNPAARGLDSLRRQFTRPLMVLMGVAGAILLSACANIAGLLLTRASARQRELATRQALGAGRARLVRQLLTESVLLALLGGGAGVAVALALGRVLPAALSESGDAVVLDMSPDVWLLAFATIACLAAGLASGLLPAMRTSAQGLVPRLARTVSGVRSAGPRLFLGNTLVAVQVAGSLVLLIGAGLFVRTLVNLRAEALGFRPDNLLVFQLNAPLNGYEEEKLKDFYEAVQARLAAVPGVVSVGASRWGILSGSRTSDGVRRPDSDQPVHVHVHYVTPGYFETMGITIRRGRDVTFRDREGAPEIVLVNETLAKRLFGDANPLGRRLGFGSGDTRDNAEVVGVVADARFSTLREPAPVTVYAPFRQHGQHVATFAVRAAAGDPSRLLASVTAAVASIDPNVPVHRARTQRAQIDQAVRRERLFAQLMSAFAALAVLLASLGIYGTLAYSVTRRRPEIGVRMALGAGRGDIARLMLRESIVPVVAGAAAGLAGAWALVKIVEGMLFGLDARDWTTFVAAALVLTATALCAAWFPTRRATRVDPVSALRCE